jgi:hypothetical protein
MGRTCLSILAPATLFASASLFVQQTDPTSQPTTAQPKEGSVNDRSQNQQDRIANGALSGQLTAGETKDLEDRKPESRDQGRLLSGSGQARHATTPIGKQQNGTGRQIYRQKHIE